MFIGLVTGHLVATQKVAALVGKKLLVIEPLRLDSGARDRFVGTGRTMIAIDSLGAGAGEIVLICQGSSARLTPETSDLPIDAVVIGIVDSVRIGDRMVVDAGTRVGE